MKRTQTSVTLMIFGISLFILAFQSTVMAQGSSAPQEIKAISSPESETCGADKTFSFGSGVNLFKFCLSDHGNILQLQSPANYRQVTVREGYVTCGTGAANAFDAGNAEGGWEDATTITQPGGANTLPVTIIRQTTDGKLQLKQTFEWNGDEREITVTMVLKNLSGASLTDVKLARYFDADLSSSLNAGDSADDIYHKDEDSVLGKDNGSGAGHHGLSLTALSFAQAHSTAVESFFNFSNTRSTCTPVAASVPTAAGDFVGRVTYSIGTLSAGASKTVKVLYRRI